MEFRVLGRFIARQGDHSFVPSAAKSRKVLALLVLNANHIVLISALQRELWGDEPPRSALTTLQTYILQLRKLMNRAISGSGLDAKDVLVTMPTGYMLRSPAGAIDVESYQDLAQQGETALLAKDYERASDRLSMALNLWESDALVDVQMGALLRSHAARLEESRTSILEQRIEADVRLGRHRRVLGELAGLSNQHPYNENFHAQYMVALHRSGRRSHALSTYQELRRRLIDDLGLEPRREVQQLHQRILTCDPALEFAGGETTGPISSTAPVSHTAHAAV